MIAVEAIRLWHNENAFLNNVNNQYSDEFARAGAKAGQSIRIRAPVDYIIRTGPTAVVQDTIEPIVNLTVASQAGVDMSFSTVDRTMTIDKFSERYIRPAINVTAGYVAVTLMTASEGGASGFAANINDTTGAMSSPSAATWLGAKALLVKASPPTSDRKIIMDPVTESNTVSTLSGLFNSQPRIARQYESGEMMQALGFDWMSDPTAIIHTTGTLATTPTWVPSPVSGWSFGTLNGANQGLTSASTLTVTATTGTLTQGDIICIAGVHGVNRITKQSDGRLRNFTVTAPVASGATSIPIAPALLGPNGATLQPQQTVDALPATNAVIYSRAPASSIYRKNMAYHPDAITLAMVDLIEPPNVEVSRRAQDTVSVRVLTQYQGTSDQLLTRLDILFGQAYLRPEWIVVVPDPVI
jgi:hypothetical protein